MVRSRFCLAPRGDTASSKRTYEAIAAGCIPVIITDGLSLPFDRRLVWSRFSLRFTEAEALADPLGLLAKLRAMPPDKVAAMRAALLEARPNFLWHTDPARPSALDQVFADMCAEG